MGLINRNYITVGIVPPSGTGTGPDRSNAFTIVTALLSAGGLLAAITYGLGWLAVARLLAPFNVAPEEIGVTSAWVLFRVPFHMLPITVLAFLLWATLSAKRHLGPKLYSAVRIAAVVQLQP